MNDEPRILGRPLKVVNIGLEEFALDFEAQGAPVVQLDWHPPAGGDQRLVSLLERLDQGEPRQDDANPDQLGR